MEHQDLYTRLETTHKEALISNKEKYPHIVAKIIRVLKYKEFYNDLTIEEVKTLCTYCNLNWNKIDLLFGEDIFKVRKNKLL